MSPDLVSHFKFETEGYKHGHRVMSIFAVLINPYLHISSGRFIKIHTSNQTTRLSNSNKGQIHIMTGNIQFAETGEETE